MNYDNLFGIHISESFARSLEPISKMYVELYNQCNIQNNLSASFNELQNSLNKAFSGIASLNYTQAIVSQAMKNLSNSFKPSLDAMLGISKMIDDSFDRFKTDVDKAAYVLDDECITFEEADEVKEDILELVSENFNEETLEKCKEKWKEKHSFIYDVLVGVLIGLITIMAQIGITNAITKKDSNVYSEPNNKSSIILNIPKDSSITIIDETTNYYYKIIYTDAENNSDSEGYMYKANAIKE